MKRLPTPLGILLLSALILLGCMYLSADAEAFDCCPPPHRPSQTPRYPQDSTVTVYIDISYLNTPAGFSDLEVDAITFGIQDWMNQPNNARVTFNIMLTTTPPPVPTAQNPATHQMAVVRYVDVLSASAVADTQTSSMGQYVFNIN